MHEDSGFTLPGHSSDASPTLGQKDLPEVGSVSNATTGKSEVHEARQNSKFRPLKYADSWPAEHIASLISWIKDGFSHGQASIELNKFYGTAYTRNACCGKAFRLGLKSVRTAKRDAIEKPITDRRERDRIRQRKRRAEKAIWKPRPDAPIQI